MAPLLTLLALTAALPFQVDGGPANRATVNLYGGGTVSGYTFNVVNQGGSLPYVTQGLRNELNLRLYKKVSATLYGLLCDMPAECSGPTSGILLEPGDYLVREDQGTRGLQIAGRWIGQGDVERYWQVKAGYPTYETVNLDGGGSTQGFKFGVVAKPDGSLPVVTTLGMYSQQGLQLGMFRKLVSGSYAQVTDWNANWRPGPGFFLNPGDYLARTSPIASPLSYRYCVIATGWWTAP